MANIYDVAKRANVSSATISRVINKKGVVSERTRQKVEQAILELGYRPSAAAKSLASNRTDSIGILVEELNSPFHGTLMEAIEHEFRKAQKHTIITTGHSDEAKEKEGIEFLISRNCDALILQVEAVSDDYLIELAKGKTPFVMINRYIEELSDRCIILDNELGGYLATKQLLDLGHKTFAYISGPAWKDDACKRLKGHKRALAEAGVPFDSELVFEGDYQEKSGFEGFKALSQKNKPFGALVCGNDEMAAGALEAARESGVKLPEELSLMGFDDNLFCRFMYPKLSTICLPIRDMSQMAAYYVLNLYQQKNHFDISLVFEPTVVMRDSAISPT